MPATTFPSVSPGEPDLSSERVGLLLRFGKRATFTSAREARYSDENKTLPNNPVLLPSISEHTQLQRAFLRFGLYCQVFPGHESDPYGPGRNPPSDYRADQQFSLFLANLMPWEVEAMCCIEQHFSSRIGNIIDELEELIHAVMSAPGVVLPEPSRPTSQSSAEEQSIHEKLIQDNLIKFADLDLTDLGLFGRDGRHESPEYISYMTSLGLDFMYNLAVSNKRKRTEMIQSNHPVTQEFLPEALDHAPRLPSGPEQNIPHDIVNDDDPSHSNLGYRMFRNASKSGLYMRTSLGYSQYPAMRQLGYVFWDTSRIVSPEVSEKLLAAAQMSLDESKLRFDRRWRETAEDRLKGTKLPKEQFERIEREFGSLLFDDQ
ncbi:hypothetical protein EDB81DRAFT_634672 [Dactylonectria macrodidyma]|uniref:Uncharacterized protein n=1 Tax=Dactylonectria macrodidyma TaxID=307937 RepID=A0A9P9JNP3_9HYPO|nr:hypothetical protein EDB81DRAFT_634672 [Dactylonectria macrodidyma]